jgi:hypothetical protein
MDYLNRQEIFLLMLNKNPPTPLIHIVLRLIVFGANSKLIWIVVCIDTLNYLYLWYFLMSQFSQQTSKPYQTFHFGLLFKTANFRVSSPYNVRNPFADATEYLGFNILL